MQLNDVLAQIGSIPHMTPAQAQRIYSHFAVYGTASVLELGFAHGVSSCYLAGALDEFNGGHLTTIDRITALRRSPNIYQLLRRCGLGANVNVIVTETSYTWPLMEFLETNPQPTFDFAYIDGAHLWDVDGFAFLLVDRLLRPGGWVVFDDLNWSLNTSPSMRNLPWVRSLPSRQRSIKQVRKVFDLLVRTHDRYGDFRDDHGWGWARKLR
jgi:predicted O-methyltransferase YrrM